MTMFWAKSNSMYKSASDPLVGTPLDMHLLDSAGVARRLWDTWIPDSVKSIIVNGMQCEEDPRQAREFYAISALLHDIGKASPAFQGKVSEFEHLLDLDVKPVYRGTNPFDLKVIRQEHHTRCGDNHLIKSPKHKPIESTLRYRSLGALVSGHHGRSVNNFPDDRRVKLSMYGDKQWAERKDALISDILEAAGYPEGLPEFMIEGPLSAAAFGQLQGLVVLADWIASNEKLIPLLPPDQWRSIPRTTERGNQAVDLLGLPPQFTFRAPSGSPKEVFAKRFPEITPNPMQEAVIQAARNGAKLIIVEAPTGTGKTEAALAAAEIMAEKWGRSGISLCLPTRVSANALQKRLIPWSRRISEGEQLTFTLHHGAASSDVEYSKVSKSAYFAVQGRANNFHGGKPWDHLMSTARMGIYDEGTDKSDDATKPCDCDTGAEVHTWLAESGKQDLATLTLGTVDGALRAGLDVKHTAVRHVALASKVLIVDEVHSSDAYMRAYLNRVLEWAGVYGTPVIAMTATAGTELRNSLINAYTHGNGDDTDEGRLLAPTVITSVTDGDGSSENDPSWHMDKVDVDYAGDKPPLLVRPAHGVNTSKEVAEYAHSLYSKDAVVAVVCNTVNRATEVYEHLRHLGTEAELHHSRFARGTRADREEKLVTSLGRGGTRAPRVVVGTQVLEQSLDIDADVMISDICPMDVLVQRAGRVHRHRRDDRIPYFSEPLVYVAGIGDDTGFEPTCYVHLIYSTWQAMSTKVWIGEGRVLDFVSESAYIRDCLDGKVSPEEGVEKERWEANRDWYIRRDSGMSARADGGLIDSPSVVNNGFNENNINPYAFPSSKDKTERSSVRIGMENNVVLLKSELSALRLPSMFDPNGRFATEDFGGRASREALIALASTTTPLPLGIALDDKAMAQLAKVQNGGGIIPKHTRMLRFTHEENGVYSVTLVTQFVIYHIEYSSDLGLVVKKSSR